MFRRSRGNEQQQSQRGPTRYQMRQKLIAFGDDYYIHNEQGQRVFFVDGKMLRVRDTLYFKDMQGNELCEIQERMMRARDTMAISRGNEVLAKVHKAMIAPMRERYEIDVEQGGNLKVQGNILDHEYSIERDNFPVAQVSKRWFRVADTYGVEIAPNENDILILAATVCIDAMSHGDEH